MEFLYNPELMPEHEVKETFVARQDIVDELVSLIEHQPRGAGVQHAVIIAPRGMGKTTLLLMLRFAIRDSKLAKQWQTVQFPEERYNIYDLADFWIEILQHLDEITDDAELHQEIEKLKVEYSNKDELQEAALALIKDWRRKHKKRILVLVDNFDMILEQINDERDNARLRDVLMNDGSMMLIGGATTFFHEARAYDQPLYNFFKIYDLPNLKFEEMQELLRRRAALDKQEDFEQTLKENKSRLRVLEHFTGGNPRLVLMLYRVVTQSGISEVRHGLEKMLDEVTPYYKSKVKSLPPQQRKILDHIARVSSETSEGLTPGQIATATRMSPNQASAQLKRLVENGYVRAANLRGRSSYYTLSERLYAIWHQMRFGRNARERMGWLVSILKAIYDADEMGIQSNVLEKRLYDHLKVGRFTQAGDTLEHWTYLLEAMAYAPGGLSVAQISTVKAKQAADITLACWRGAKLFNDRKFDEAIQHSDSALETDAAHPLLWLIKGFAFVYQKRWDEALSSIDQALKTDANLPLAWLFRGLLLGKLGRYEEFVTSIEREPEIDADITQLAFARTLVYLLRFHKHSSAGATESANKAWKEVQHSARQSNDDTLYEIVMSSLLHIAVSGRWIFVRDLIEHSELTEQFFPLARAIDHLLTGDDALLEKLSPEVRGVVEEIVGKLREANDQTEQPNRMSRSTQRKATSQRRVKTQLR